MTKDKTVNIPRIAVVLMFAITFMLVGWLSPVLYATYIPADEVMEVHSFEAEDASVDAGRHYICLDRTVRKDTTGEVFTELYLLNDNTSQRMEVKTEETQSYFQQGRSKVVEPYELPPDLQPGKYRYLLVAKMELAEGRVTKTMSFESAPFEITSNELESSNHNEACG